MHRYDKLKKILDLKKLSSTLEPVSEEILVDLLIEHIDIPYDFINFLREIGAGTIGDMYYSIYSSLIVPEDIYDPLISKNLEGILFFGDDFTGYSTGFSTLSSWKIVEVDSFGNINNLDLTFHQFIIDKFSDYLDLFKLL